MSNPDSYTRKRAFAVADDDAIETAEKAADNENAERPEFVIDPDGTDSESVEINPVSESEAAVAPFRESLQKHTESESDTQLDSIRQTGVQTEDAVPDAVQTRDERHRKQRVSKRIELINQVNKRLENADCRRRYFVRQQGASARGPVFEDEIGKYRYEIDRQRPSDVVENIESWIPLDRSQKVVKTVAALVNMYPLLMDDVRADERATDAVETVLVSEQEAPRDEDTFEMETVKSVEKAIQSVTTDGR